MKTNTYKITSEGSLGVLAYGDIAFREWRKIKNSEGLKLYDEEE